MEIKRLRMAAYAIVETSRHGRVFVKTNSLNRGALQLEAHRREVTALHQLHDLAVPHLVELTPRERSQLFGAIPLPVVALKYVANADILPTRRLSPSQAVGLSLFVTEQLVAFRRRGLIYSDMKPRNILVNRAFSDAKVIDLEGCVAMQPNGRYRGDHFCVSEYFEPPEFSTVRPGGFVDERVVVYQLAATIVALLTLTQDDLPISARYRVARREFHAGAPRLVLVLKKALSARIDQRPATYEHLFEGLVGALRHDGLSGALRVWHRLRQRHSRVLDRLGLRADGMPATHERAGEP